MSTSSSQNDQPSRDFYGHGLNQTFTSPNQLQQQQHHLQSFLGSNSNIALQQQTAVIQQQTALASSPLSIAPSSQNPTLGSVLQAPPHSSQFVHWPNPLMTNASFLQQQHPPTQSPDVQQQQLNDFLFNIHAQAAYAAAAATATVPTAQVPSATTQQETYTVLRVGKGNFLKIYHCPENAMGNVPGETSYGPMPSYNPNQNANFHHANPQESMAIQSPLQQQQSQNKLTGTANSSSAPVFNSYELFSSSTFTQLPTAEMPPLLLLGPTAKPQTMRTEDIRNSEQSSCVESSNMIIHNMPNNNNSNWTCNHVTTSPVCVLDNQEQNEFLKHNFAESEDTLVNNDVRNVALEMTPNDLNAIQNCHQLQTHLQDTSLPKDNVNQALTTSASAAPLLLTQTLKHEIPRQEAPKKRIVAEVKPMRMTYSDVLSKLNNQTQNSQQNNCNNASMNTTTTSTTSVLANQRNQQKSLKVDSNSAANSRRIIDDSTATRTSAKKSPMHENKDIQQQQQLLNNKLHNQKRSQTTVNISTNNNLNSNNNIGSTSNKPATTQKNLINSKNNNPSKSNCNGSNVIDNQQSKKQRSSKNSDIHNNGGKNCSLLLQPSSGTNSSTSPTNNYNSTNNTYARKPKSTNSGNLSSSTGQQRSRYQNNTNASYSYSSTRRSRNNVSYGASSLNNSSSVNGTGSNRNYELVKLFLRTWYTYTLKVLIWLFYLVYDIVVLGCSILYERLIFAYNSGKTYGKQLYKELKENSNKPGVWFKSYCRKFDAKFSKTSKWAFWRKFFKKNPPEASSDSIKTGRLPATGDEAMHQLLNCKGKDAYSILGVPPNSSQEQIRKHYKKIAVLVHPDKNKQAGAEEAFKVLQRAFELIGEPENRHAYDQSLAEALHAEKAWTELHDLLSQLQTKITEAANTIRCSTCGLRHPRKITERPHYAARECTSCKIRHSAREGDIWAETSMLGLRWKYLALMEGKVYDITEWANCQKGALAHLEPNSHMVQYRIVRGAQHQHQQKHQAQQQQQHQKQRTGSQYPGTGGAGGGKFKRDNIPPSEASLHEFLDNLYSGQHPQQQQNTSANAGSSRRRNRRN